jgi:hypothetical protein
MPIKDMNKKYSFTSYSQLESKYPSRKPPQWHLNISSF